MTNMIYLFLLKHLLDRSILSCNMWQNIKSYCRSSLGMIKLYFSVIRLDFISQVYAQSLEKLWRPLVRKEEHVLVENPLVS